MGKLSREQILTRKPKRTTLVVPELDGEVTIQALSAGAALAIAEGAGDEGHRQRIVDIVIASVVNDDGSPMFSREDRESLQRLEFGAMKRIADGAIEFNGMSDKKVEEL